MRALRNLVSVGQTLKALVLLENPLAKTDDYRMYVLSHLPQLERLDKDPITAEEKSAAQEKVRNLFRAFAIVNYLNFFLCVSVKVIFLNFTL